MSYAHQLDADRDRDLDLDDPHRRLDRGPAPGRLSATQALNGPNGVMPSGILMRKARDAAGVVDGAEDLVARAGASSGRGLPDHLRAKFESVLGTDLSAVRVHTGAASAAAADAVGARAYTIGNDIHFADGQLDAASPEGEHLLAHEVAHTVQQQGGAAHRQNKLAVSSAGDAHEVEADRAADAMVAGTAFSLGAARGGIHRKAPAPDPSSTNASYARGGEKWKGGTALTEDEYTQFAAKKTEAAAKAVNAVMQVAGVQNPLDGGEVVANLDQLARTKYADAIDRIEAELESRKKPPHPQVGPDTATLERRLADLEDQSQGHLWQSIETAKNLVAAANGFAGSVLGKVSELNGKVNLLNPELFENAAEWTGKVGTVLSALEVAGKVLDRTAFDNFAKNPSLNSAEIWADHIGQTFNSLSGLAAGLPMGWDVVIGGMLKMPGAVSAQFASVVRDHYAKIDAMTQDPFAMVSEILPDGGHSRPLDPSRE